MQAVFNKHAYSHTFTQCRKQNTAEKLLSGEFVFRNTVTLCFVVLWAKKKFPLSVPSVLLITRSRLVNNEPFLSSFHLLFTSDLLAWPSVQTLNNHPFSDVQPATRWTLKNFFFPLITVWMNMQPTNSLLIRETLIPSTETLRWHSLHSGLL